MSLLSLRSNSNLGYYSTTGTEKESKIRRWPFCLGVYGRVSESWPEGRVVLASGKKDTVCLYVSCAGRHVSQVLRHQGDRKTQTHEEVQWTITPSYMRAIKRSEWCLREGRDSLLALTLTRDGFEELFRIALEEPDLVQLDWVCDVSPLGFRTERYIPQFKLAPHHVKRFLIDMVQGIDDVTPLAIRGRRTVIGFSWDHWTQMIFKLRVPREIPYKFADKQLPIELGLSITES